MGRFYQFNRIIILGKIPLCLVTLLVRAGQIEHHIGSQRGPSRERSPFRCIASMVVVRESGPGIGLAGDTGIKWAKQLNAEPRDGAL